MSVVLVVVSSVVSISAVVCEMTVVSNAAYADDLTLLAPTPRAIRLLLQICEEYGKNFSVSFNASKSVSMYVGKHTLSSDLHFCIDGNKIEFVNNGVHLGHVVDDKLDDKSDIISKRNSICAKINNVLCYFSNRDPAVKLKLMIQYCSDFYGSVLWDLNHPSVADLSVRV